VLCVLDIDTTDQQRAALAVCALLELSLDRARAEIRSGAVPPLYKSGVKYVSQPKSTCAFIPPSEVFRRKGGDCKQLTLWRLAELREAGEYATPRVIWIPEPKGFKAHALLRRKDGRIEDPSVNLGMKAY
jgi:hypothetical protein